MWSVYPGFLFLFTQVLIHVTTSTVQTQNNTFVAVIPENVNGTTTLIDLNYTDGSNTKFQYHLLQIIPDGMFVQPSHSDLTEWIKNQHDTTFFAIVA